MTEAELKENFVQVRTPDKQRIARITKKLIGENRTGAEFAQAVGLSPSMVSRIINGKYQKPLTEDILIKLVSDCSEEQDDNLQMLIRANGMISKEQQERRYGPDGHFSIMSEAHDREISVQNIITSELFARGIAVRKVPRLGYRNITVSSKFFRSPMFYDLKVEMVDTARPYEWNFAIYAMRVDEKNETRKVNMFQRMIERYSYLFLMDAWEPQLLADTKT